VCRELLGEKLNLTYFPSKMAENNNESHTRPHPISRIPVKPEIPMSSFKERLKALRPSNGNGSHSQVDETNPPTGEEPTNFLLLELLQKQGEQL